MTLSLSLSLSLSLIGLMEVYEIYDLEDKVIIELNFFSCHPEP